MLINNLMNIQGELLALNHNIECNEGKRFNINS